MPANEFQVGKRSVMAVLALCLALPLGAETILWDVSNIPLADYHPAGEYSEMVRLLRDEGFELLVNEDPLDGPGLWRADVAVISILSNHAEPYTEAEAERLVHFVEAGGGVIVLSDNSAINPRNIQPLLSPFGLTASRNNRLLSPAQWADHPVFEDVDGIFFDAGGAVTADEELGAEIVAVDENDLGAIAVNEISMGKVVLIGDADIWTNSALARGDNDRLALNCVRHLSRTREGRIEVEAGNWENHVLPGQNEEDALTVINVGEGPLEIALESEVDWLQFQPEHAVIEENRNVQIVVSIVTADLPPDTTISAITTIRHNDPTRDLFSYEYTLHVLPLEPVHFDVVEPTELNHSILISELTLYGGEAPRGLEIGIFNTVGLCGGGAVLLNTPLGIPIWADDAATEERDGFRPGERFFFRMYLPREDLELDAVPEFIEGPEIFRYEGLTVLTLDGRPGAIQEFNLNQRWCLISLNVQPPVFDFENVLAPLIEEDLLLMVKAGDGRFWHLEREFNNLQDWDLTRGYQIALAQTTAIEVEGLIVPYDLPINLTFGWSIIPYLPREDQPIAGALETIAERIIIVKRDDGAFYLTEWGWDGIGIMEPGEAYKIKLNAAGELVYPEGEEGVRFRQSPAVRRKYMVPTSGVDMSLLLRGLEPDVEVEIRDAEGALFQRSTSTPDGELGVPVPGDDPFTVEKDGFHSGERMFIDINGSGKSVSLPVRWLSGGDRFEKNGIAVGRATRDLAAPNGIEVSHFPIPFNRSFIVDVTSTSDGGRLEIMISDLQGRSLVEQEWADPAPGANRTFTFDGGSLPSGILFLHVRQGRYSRTGKIVHLP